MSRVFDDWYLSLSGEEQRAYDEEQRLQENHGREEWEAAHPERVTPEPPRPRLPMGRDPLDDCPF